MTGLASHAPLRELGIVALCAKRLSASEVDRSISRDGGLQGVSALTAVLGEAARVLPASFYALVEEDSETDIATDAGTLSWYDARRSSARPAERRAYVSPPFIHKHGGEGDLALILLHEDGHATVVIAEIGSSAEKQLLAAFNLTPPAAGTHGQIGDVTGSVDTLRHRDVLEAIGVLSGPATDAALEERARKACAELIDRDLDALLSDGTSTEDVSRLAREVAVVGDELTPDERFLAWVDTEERIYYLAEEACYRDRVEEGFASVAELLEFAKSPLQRRRSRAGHAMEHHFRQLLRDRSVRHAPPGTKSEGRSTPDILIPDKATYEDLSLPTDHVSMVALKRTCRDRWRQVLREANRVHDKYLVTIDPELSAHQVEDMARAGIRLVVPEPLHARYPPEVRGALLTIASCLEELAAIASRTG